MKGEVSQEVEVLAPLAEVWGVYSTMELSKVCLALMPDVISSVEVVEGDGTEEGSVLMVNHAPDWSGRSYFKEKFTRMDHASHVKEAVQIEGGYLDMGFNSYITRFEIFQRTEDGDEKYDVEKSDVEKSDVEKSDVEKSDVSSSIVRTTIEYDIPEERQTDESIVKAGMSAMVKLAEAVGKHLQKCDQEA